ncbi:Protein of unknown function [Flavobacteriaceae bacterium MAR_2010_188]|nr:Protein of unknown function [Flavobacteriaceae bacterium MAR_2010_188]
MQDKFTFKYTIVRLVPKVEREEFFNIGVILFCKRKKFLDIRYLIDEAKLKAFSCEIKKEVLENYLHAWKLICQGDASSGKIGLLDLSDRFGWLTACRSTMIQSSLTHSGVDSNPEKALEDIFSKYVL